MGVTYTYACERGFLKIDLVIHFIQNNSPRDTILQLVLIARFMVEYKFCENQKMLMEGTSLKCISFEWSAQLVPVIQCARV